LLSTRGLRCSASLMLHGSVLMRALSAFESLGVPTGLTIACLCWASLLSPSHALSSLLSRSYRSLDAGTRIEWLSRCISNIHAVAVTAGFYYAVAYEPTGGIHDGGPLMHRVLFRVLLTFGLGYFVYDSILVIYAHKTISAPLSTLVHHAVCCSGVYYVLCVDTPLT
jgi:TLC domain